MQAAIRLVTPLEREHAVFHHTDMKGHIDLSCFREVMLPGKLAVTEDRNAPEAILFSWASRIRPLCSYLY
jgi:hypothetical protein